MFVFEVERVEVCFASCMHYSKEVRQTSTKWTHVLPRCVFVLSFATPKVSKKTQENQRYGYDGHFHALFFFFCLGVRVCVCVCVNVFCFPNETIPNNDKVYNKDHVRSADGR